MAGFFISNFENNKEINREEAIYKKYEYNKLFVRQSTNNCFFNDKVFSENDKFFYLTEGVILNKQDLLNDSNIDTLEKYIEFKMRKGSKTFFNDFRGSFSGAIIDKENDSICAYTNHYGDNALFYYYSKDTHKFIISSQIDWIVDCLIENNIKYTMNEKAVYYMLTYAFMADDCTYANEIRRLLPGQYISVQDDDFSVDTYYEIKRNKLKVDMTEEEIIDEMDRLFRESVRLEFEKDIEYGKKHIAELSGGLDSRMNYWVAHEMGYKNILAVTYCQSNYLDELIAKQIASYWNDEIIVWPMDSGKHLFDIEDVVKLNFGVSLYSGPGSQLRIFDTINMNKFGLLHTGQIGDVVFGTFIKNVEQLNEVSPEGMYNDYFCNEYKDESYVGYANKEEHLMMVRAMIGCMGSHFITRKYTEIASPFLNVDLLDFMMSIPIEMRINHSIYQKWILKKYPKAADFIWEKSKEKIGTPKWKTGIKWFLSSCVIALKNPKVVLKYLGFNVKLKPTISNKGMNPIDKWVSDNKGLALKMDAYYKDNICTIKDENIKNTLKRAYNVKSVLLKIQVVTVLAAFKIYKFQ